MVEGVEDSCDGSRKGSSEMITYLKRDLSATRRRLFGFIKHVREYRRYRSRGFDRAAAWFMAGMVL